MVLFEDMGLGGIGSLALTGFEKWIMLGINILLSTLISGIALAILVAIINKTGNETGETGNAFLMALVISVVNYAGIVGLLGSVLPIPMLMFVLPLLVWIVAAKLFFSIMEWKHVLVIGVVGYAISIFIVPPITQIILGLLPI